MMRLPYLEDKSAQEILRWARDTFKDKVVLASSFGAEDVVLIDMMVRVYNELKVRKIKPQIFTLDTGRLPQETYDVIERIKEKYKVKIDFYSPDTKEVEEMLNRYGPNLFYKSIQLRKLCCRIRKVNPLQRALSNYRAWITGLRREQAVTRLELKKVERDKAHNNIIKINPLTDWKENDVWCYIKENNIPYNTLHDRDYPSIGCAPCTRGIKPGEDIRAGRWWWESPEHKECGLHISKKN
jgi:phosphoadenosine phosphosulfate reductase